MTKKISFSDVIYSIAPVRIKLIKVFDYLAGGAVAFLLPPLPKKELPKEIKNVLIIRPGGIGDAVFLLPILKALKNKGYVVDILCEKRNAEVFTSQIQLVNKICLCDQQPFALFANSYDVIIDTEQWHYLSALIAYFFRLSFKIGFATRPKRAKLFHQAVEYDVDCYELDNFLRLFQDILTIDGRPERSGGYRQLKLEGSFNIDASTQAWAKEQIGEKFVTVFLGASIVLRRLNEEQVMAVINIYLKKYYSIALLGGKDVESFVNSLLPSRDGKEGGNKIYNYVGKLSLIQSAALIQQSALFIGPDSGLMHLACAIDIPVIGIFGPGNMSKWGPKGEKHKIITENVSCAPCTRFGYTLPTCKGSFHCMKDIKIENSQLS